MISRPLCLPSPYPLLLAVAIASHPASARAQQPGLRLFQPLGSAHTSLVDTNGNVVHSWSGNSNVTAHLLADGSLLRGHTTGRIPIGGATGRLQRVGFDGTLLWDYTIDGPDWFMHHDIEPMPNGNVLVIVWEGQTTSDALAAGRDPAMVTGNVWYPDAILEIQQTGPTTGAVVWEWRVSDHLIQDFDATKPNFGVVADHPERIDINYPPVLVDDGDWNHCNGIDYDPTNDWIVLSSRHQSEIYIIDHSTTTAEASGHTGGARGKGGDILYRWGNPEAYGAGTGNDRQLTAQHDARFVAPGYPGAGNVTVFNNDYILSTQSAVVEIALPVDAAGNFARDPLTGQFGPAAPVWIYTDPSFYSRFISSAERLPNGNTLVCSGQQFELFEVDPAGNKVWTYTYPSGAGLSFGLFQAHHVDRSLWADSETLSTRGGIVSFRHLLGSEHARESVLLLGSISGTTPGTLLSPSVTLPLNNDLLTVAMATQFNTGMFLGTLGALDIDGAGTSSLVVGAGFIPQSLVGLELNFAHVTFDNSFQAIHASNPVRVAIAR